jgi:hypothetical protein
LTKENKSKEEVKDDIIHDYDSVLKESGVLTSVSKIISGFLLNISINPPKWIYNRIYYNTYDLYSISFAVSFFIIIFNTPIPISRNSRLDLIAL